MIADTLRRMADDPHRITPDSTEVKALADQIETAMREIHALKPRVTWLETQVKLQRRSTQPREEGGYAP